MRRTCRPENRLNAFSGLRPAFPQSARIYQCRSYPGTSPHSADTQARPSYERRSPIVNNMRPRTNRSRPFVSTRIDEITTVDSTICQFACPQRGPTVIVGPASRCHRAPWTVVTQFREMCLFMHPDTRSSWFWIPRPRQAPRFRLVCFAHAGGSAASFSALSAALPPDTELWATQLPGRFVRYREPATTSLPELVAQIADALRSAAEPDVPIALLGQSFGGLLAAEVARHLEPDRPARALVLLSACPPHLLLPFPAISREQVPDLLLRTDDGAREILECDELRDVVLDAVWADIELLHQLPNAERPTLRCPVHAIVGASDSEISAAEMSQWQQYTESVFTMDELPAPHLIASAHPVGLSDIVTGLLRSDIARCRKNHPARRTGER
ncbi:alpha/beta fold hydrolase [Streptomyces violaceusniger]|uniref:thioesterase II family protein n=1 Tax=Streptomyces violaceusniger TaxID=68280 RepID=UPI003415A704